MANFGKLYKAQGVLKLELRVGQKLCCYCYPPDLQNTSDQHNEVTSSQQQWQSSKI